MSGITLLLFFLGLFLLFFGADLLVRGSSHIAKGLGISPLVIGLTIVAFGTSAPELAVSVKAGLSDMADVAVGNVVGSNIFNILFILGISALITPLAVSLHLVRLDVPIMIGTSALVWMVGLDGKIGFLDGTFLFLGIIGYTVFLFYQVRNEQSDAQTINPKDVSIAGYSWKMKLMDGLFVIGGLAMLVVGSRWFTDGSVALARWMGLSQLVIGLTIIAAGTSMPEVVTSVVASIRGERDIAVGNVVGSNIFNILAVLGMSSMVTGDGIHVSPHFLHVDIPIMIGVSLLCLPIFFSGYVISRWEGILFLFFYILYTLYLIIDAVNHPFLQYFNRNMIIGLSCLVLLSFFLFIVKSWMMKQKSSQ